MLHAKPRTPGVQARLFPTPPWLAGAEQPSPSGLLRLPGRQLHSLSFLLWAHVSFSTQRPGCREMAHSAAAVPVLAAQAVCMQKCICMHAAACASHRHTDPTFLSAGAAQSPGRGCRPLSLFSSGDRESRVIGSSSRCILSSCSNQRDLVTLEEGALLPTRWSCTPRFAAAGAARPGLLLLSLALARKDPGLPCPPGSAHIEGQARTSCTHALATSADPH